MVDPVDHTVKGKGNLPVDGRNLACGLSFCIFINGAGKDEAKQGGNQYK